MRFFVRSLFAFAALAVVCPARAQVVFDAASNTATATASTANPIVVTWNHTVGLAKKAGLIVSVSLDENGGGATASGVIYGSEAGGPNQNMIFLGAATNGTNERAELWGLPNPSPGTHTIQVTVANGGGQNIVVAGGAKSFTNVLLTAGGAVFTATGTSLTPAVAVTNGVFDYVVDAVAYNNNVALTAGANQTNAFNVIHAAPNSVAAGSAKSGFVNTTMSWTATGTAQPWAEIAAPLSPATPQVTFDSAVGTTFSSNAATFTGSWNHTTTVAANRYLIVGVSIDLGGAAANSSGVVYGTEGGGPNQAMTLLGSLSNGTNVRTELWGLANPATGTHQITVSITSGGARNRTVVAGSQSFSGVDQSAPTGTVATASANSATPNVTTANTAYDYVVDNLAFNGNTAQIEGPQQQDRYAINTNTLTNFAGAGSGSHGYVNTNMSWSNAGATAQQWALAAVPLHPVQVAISKTASADVIKLGDSVTYTLKVTNETNAAVNNVTVTDAILAGANFVAQTGCAGTGPVTCNIGLLAAGATSAPITVTVLPTAAGTISNVATVSWNGGAAVNRSETINTLTEQKICATPGKDGAGGTLAGIKNDYWPGSASVAAGAATMTIGARAAGGAGNGITAGDLLIVMQMQDAAFDTTNDETYGEGTGSTKATGTGSGAMTSLNNAGRWEYVVASNSVGAAGGTLNFTGGGQNGGLLYNYTAQTFATTTTEGQRTFQVIRVPQYTTATLGSTLTALAWNGATGGVLAVDVSGTITLGGATVSVNGLGFRGGGGRILPGGTGVNTDFRTLATNAANGSKGEGIAGTPRYIYQSGATIGAPGVNTPLDTGVEGYLNGSYGRGAPGNAGGGSTDGDPPANDDNSGGGGGGNGGNGGAGGNGWNCNCPAGGQGGGGIAPGLTRITLGGGGGAGTSNNGSAADGTGAVLADGTAAANGYYSSGANGGGIMIIRAMQATGTATLTANGFSAANVGRDGSGGGGAGGSVLFTTQIGTLSSLTVQAKGGNGGSSWLQQAPGGSPGERHGPGGGGGGGYILTSSAAASTDASAGTNGHTTTANDSYGAQPGTAGIVQLITGNNVLPGGDGASCIITDLAVTNSAPATVQAGNNVTYTQTVQNLGAFAADGVVYMAPIPASATFQSISVPPGWTCITPAVGGTGVVTCTTPTLNAGATANFSLVVNSFSGTPAGYLMSETNSVSSNTPDSNPANNQATATTIVEGSASGAAFPDMAVTISQSTSLPTPGSNITYTETVSNLGGFTANNPTYSFTIPPNTTFQSMGAPPAGWTCITPAVNGTGTISCSAASLAAGTTLAWPSIVVKVNAGATPGTAITATPSVGTSSQDPYTANNTASVTSTVVGAGTADVAITISSTPNPLDPGEFYSYTAVAKNNGNSAAANVTVTIPVPAGANFRSITPPAGWTCSTPAVGASGNITCTIASLAAGASATFTPQVEADTTTASGTTLTSNATITTTTSETITTNNSASASNLVTTRTNADVAIVKTDSPDPVGNGQLITYRLAVTNNGPAIATNVTISDPLPAAVLFVSVNPSIGSCSGTTTINCALGTLPVGNTQYVDLIVQANGTGTDTNTATASRTETDPIPSNDSSTATTTVLAVTLVRMREFSATQDKKDVLLTWRTDFESDNLGFNVYRDAGGQRVKINKSLIAGTAMLTKHKDDQNGNSAGHTYRLRDKLDSANGFVQYFLEDVDIAGRRTMHGPVSPVAGTVNEPANATPLPGLGANGAVIDSPLGYGVVRSVALPAPTDKQVKQQLDLAADQGLKIYVTQEGWYRVTRAQMVAAGFDPGSKLKQLSLFMQGIEQPMVVNDDSVEFYGQRLDTFSTGARTYWLSAKGSAARLPVSHTKGGDPLTGSIPFTVQKLDRSLFLTFVLGTGDNVYFGPLVSSEPATQQLNAGNIDTSYGGNATLEVTLQGGTDGPHPTEVDLNGHNLGTAAFANQEQKTFTFTVPQSWLTAGANSVTFTALGGDMDFSVGVSTKLTVQHLLRADGGAFEASLPGGRVATVGGFTTSNVRAIDVTDPAAPVELETSVAADANGGFAASFTPAGNDARVVLAFDDSRILAPQEMAANKPSTWSDKKNAADLVIISNNAFLQAAATLPPVRQRDGISSALVDVEDLYDEFNFGIRGPEAIRSFLQSTAQWKTKPRWVLLVGDASIDPRNYMDMGAYDFVPTKLVDTALLKTVSDDWLADVDGDGNPDFAIGRIPVRTSEDAALVFGKITARGTPSGTWANSVLSIFDRPIAWDFAAAAAQANANVPHSMTLQTIDFAHSASPHDDVVGALNQGQLLVDYVGHGAVELWSLDGIFTSPDATALANGNRLPFVVAMNCLNGYFADLFSYSMAEALLEAPNGGAVAVWASSALTEPNGQQTMNTELMRQLFGGGNLTIGEAVNRAKAAVTDPDVRKSWILFGDPSMRLK
ncbi:MAG TPA: C25 family cysteine peptidase [Thermoanaerobaculia bacterium]|nr:C25 family cysteine peptidase [Thermoanaerobaculia bacterium]